MKTKNIISFLSKITLAPGKIEQILLKKTDTGFTCKVNEGTVRVVAECLDPEINQIEATGLAVMEASKMGKILGILSEDCTVTVKESKQGDPIALTFADASNTTAKVVLGSMLTFTEEPWMSKQLAPASTALVRLTLQPQIQDKINKAAIVLDKANITIVPNAADDDLVTLVFGYSSNNMDQIKFDLPADYLSTDLDFGQPIGTIDAQTFAMITSVSKDCPDIQFEIHKAPRGAKFYIRANSALAQVVYVVEGTVIND